MLQLQYNLRLSRWCGSPHTPGNYRHVAISCLERGVGNSSKFTFTADAHTFNFLLEGGYTYLVVATEGCALGLGRAACA